MPLSRTGVTFSEACLPGWIHPELGRELTPAERVFVYLRCLGEAPVFQVARDLGWSQRVVWQIALHWSEGGDRPVWFQWTSSRDLIVNLAIEERQPFEPATYPRGSIASC